MSHRNKSTRSMKYFIFWVDKNGIPMITGDCKLTQADQCSYSTAHSTNLNIKDIKAEATCLASGACYPKAGPTFSCKSSSKFVTSSCVLRSLIKPVESLDFLSWDQSQCNKAMDPCRQSVPDSLQHLSLGPTI